MSLPVFLTEYGYETNPPNPYRGVSLRLQSQYLNQAEYMAFQDLRVRALSQFLLVDSAPNVLYRPGSVRYWSTFQTGLEFLNGTSKPAFNAYRLPIWIGHTSVKQGAKVWCGGCCVLLRTEPISVRRFSGDR